MTDKRKVRRDLADVLCSTKEGVRGNGAKDWHLVDELVANSKFDEAVQERAREFAAASDKADGLQGIEMTPMARDIAEDGSVIYSLVEVALDRAKAIATVTIKGPDIPAPADSEALQAEGANTYMLRLARIGRRHSASAPERTRGRRRGVPDTGRSRIGSGP